MSQFYTQNSGASPPPPEVPTEFVTEDGSAIPAANILNVTAEDIPDNNDEGIQTIADPDLSNNLVIQLTNRVRNDVVTNDDTPTNLISFGLGGSPGVVIIQGNVVAYNVTDDLGATYTLNGSARTNGLTGVEIGSELKDVFEEGGMVATDFTFGVAGNQAFIDVTGLPGKTINWSAFFTYRKQF